MKTFKVIKKFTTTKLNFPRSAVIVAAKRTPVGTFLGKMSNLKATELGSIAVNSALDSTGLSAEEIRNAIEEVYLGNVCSAGLGQNPARQVSLGAKIPINVPCTTVNKVCSSGLKTVTLGAQSISLGISDAVVTGGFESMSNVPFYITKHRKGHSYGNQEIIDGLALDGLTDIYKGIAMGECGEKTASDFSINRAAQDEFTIASYERALKGMKNGFFDSQIASVFINEKEGTISEDEEPKRFNKEKLLKLRPAFRKEGTITAASSSSFNDGASALVLMSEEKAMKLGLNPLARIVSFADYEMEPIDFCISPSKAIEICINRAGKKIADVDYFEINEAFAVTVLANMKILGLDHQQVNVYGGAVALGHPIGMSGGRILINLINVLKERKAKFGIAGVCNGGGGSTAVLIENI